MVERVCPLCQHGNPLDNRFCGRCGEALERQLPATRHDAPLSVSAQQLPVPWKQVGQTLALGLATLAAEAGMAWLRRKVDHLATPATQQVAPPTRAIVPVNRTSPPAASNTTIVSQRVVEIWDEGSLTRQVVERTFWRKEQN